MVELHRGWGDLANATIGAASQPENTAIHGRAVRDAVEQALDTERFGRRLDYRVDAPPQVATSASVNPLIGSKAASDSGLRP